MVKLSDSHRKVLEKNPNVLRIKNSRITYTPEFKIKAVKAFLNGEDPSDIFKDAKFDLSLFHPRFPGKAILRWKQVYDQKGEAGLREERRGKGSPGRPKKTFKSLEEELEYLRMEVYLLKKLRALASEKDKGSK